MGRTYELIAVGGGPAGIASAVEGIHSGLSSSNILILEKGRTPIEAIRRFYPEKKMTIANYKGLPTETLGHIPKFPDLTKDETIRYFDDLISRYSIDLRLLSEVFKIDRIEGGGFRVFAGSEIYESKAVMVGIGILGRPNKPEFKIPAPLKPKVHYDLTTQKLDPCRILIVGGGDTSSEYAQLLHAEGFEVEFIYRGDALKRMMNQNSEALVKLRNEKKLEVRLSCEIEELIDDAGQIRVRFKNCKDPESKPYDRLLFAIGGTTPINFLKTIGVDCDASWPKYGASGETNIPALYLLGDLVAGKTGGSIITAYNSAFRSVQHLCQNKILGDV